jgi:energy-coupling factor transporter ATP-binding protein EcfA2
VVFLLGPKGVGKTTVALHLAGEERRYVPEEALLSDLATHARTRKWDEALLAPVSLVLEAPCFLSRRPAVTRALQALLQQRIARGVRSFICEAADGDPMGELIGCLDPKQKATMLLRFPVGRGRRRYVLRMCDELGIDRVHARAAAALDPWTYAQAREALMALSTRS